MRLVVPLLPGFVSGRLLADAFGQGTAVGGVLAVAAGVAGMACCAYGVLSLRKKVASGRKNTWFGAFFFLFLFLYGAWASCNAWEDVRRPWPEQPQVWRGVLCDVPKVSARSVSAEVLLLPLGEQESEGRKVLLGFRKDSLSSRLCVGDEILFRCVLRLPENRGNPDEFDYAAYLSVRGVSGRAYVPVGEWVRMRSFGEGDAGLSLLADWRVRALVLRDELLAAYRSAGLSGEELALFSALTLGERSGLSEELKDVYAEVGVSHVLALSGMHLTYLVALLDFLLLRFCRRLVWRCLGGAVAFVLVWGYTFLAGLPPSLVRATVMYSLMLAGSLAGRTGFSMNSLAVSAVMMLCMNPLLLYDVSFQLSFLAMVGILTVYPRCGHWFPSSVPYVGWAGKSLWLSFSAQVFTVPLVVYRFGMFSVWSALATLLISPLAALLVYCMPVLLLAVATGFYAGACAKVVAGLVALQNACLRWMADWPFAVLYVDGSLPVTLLCYVAVLMALARPWMPYVRWLKGCLLALLMLVCAVVVDRQRRQEYSGWVFYNNPRCPAVHVVYSPSCSYLFPACADSVPGQMGYIAETFWRKRLSAPPVVVEGDFKDTRVTALDGLVECGGKCSFLLLSDNRWERVRADSLAEVDYVYVCRGFTGSLLHLSRLFRPRCVVLDASLSRWGRERYARECGELGWGFHDMQEHGALRNIPQ